MERVPSDNKHTEYLVIGNGRLARHFLHYFDLLGVSYNHCTRQNLHELAQLAKPLVRSGVSGRILLLIRDDQMMDFIRTYKQQVSSKIIWIHCSGVLSMDDAEAAHPLSSFSDVLFEDGFYASIPFVTEKGRRSFGELFPELPNPSYEIGREQKELYHAWCSMAGNFSTMLWQHFFHFLKHDLHLENQVAYAFLASITENLIRSKDPLTGPLKRGDTRTIERHLDQLKNTPMEGVYKSFINLYKNSKL